MKKLHKNMLFFSIVYWLLVAVGLLLTGLSMQKVPIGFYGLRAHYFSSHVDSQYYSNGLYHTGVGYYFVLYPQPRSYVLNKQLTVINKDLEKVTVAYTLCYRINPSGILDMYYSVADRYEEHLVAVVNNIVSGVFSTLSQGQSRVTAQELIIAEYNANGKIRVDVMFAKALAVEAIWLDQLKFDTSEPYYDSAYIYSASSSPAYEAASYNLTLAKLQLNAAKSALETSKQVFVRRMELSEQRGYASLTSGAISSFEDNIMNLSTQFNVSRVLNYYKPAGLVFK